MTTTTGHGHDPSTATENPANRTPNDGTAGRRGWHRIAVATVAGLLALGVASVTFGISTSPGRTEVAIPGIRGNGGG